MTRVLGIHHVTAIAGDPQRNLDFYAGVLGLRFIKRTVNFDDPHTYHFYFGDDVGTPGSIMTFFPWPHARRGRQGTGQVAVTSFAVPPAAIGFWIERLLRYGVRYKGPSKRNGQDSVLAFSDPDGLMLELVSHVDAAQRSAWDAPGISRDVAIHGFHSVTLWEESGDATDQALTDTLGFRFQERNGATRRYVAGDGGPGTIVDVRAIGGFLAGQPGVGTVHHVAFRVKDDTDQLAVRSRALQAGRDATDVIDRSYFRSVYFREPGGVLFEVATDTPGFTIDEPAERLGERLMLPARYEAKRLEIEAILPPVQAPSGAPTSPPFADAAAPSSASASAPFAGADALTFVHRFEPAARDAAGGASLLLLHGTGGNEDDLIALGRRLHPDAALLSPRGQVEERGALRFFRRIREGVFDLEDLAMRTDDLAKFIEDAAEVYELDAGGIVAVGFSNGANIAGSLLLRRPELLRAAVLLSPMVPFEPDPLPHLQGKPVFIGAGRADSMVPARETERLADLLRRAGADVTIHWDAGGHAITPAEIEAAAGWVARL